jgi:hypothetical protein
VGVGVASQTEVLTEMQLSGRTAQRVRGIVGDVVARLVAAPALTTAGRSLGVGGSFTALWSRLQRLLGR